jgi:PAS domain S-box-containing protein
MAINELTSTEEAARAAAVPSPDILDTPPDGAFDRVAALAAQLLDMPIAVISVVDHDRVCLTSAIGMDAGEVERVAGLSAAAMSGGSMSGGAMSGGAMSGGAPWVVTDASADPRTLADPLVTGETGIRFCAGVPLTTPEGHIGALCVLDTQPHTVSQPQIDALVHLAGIVVDQLELRRSAREAVASAENRLHDVENLVRALQFSLLPPNLPDISFLEVAAHSHPASRSQVGGDFYDAFPLSDQSWGFVIGDVCGKGPQAAGRTSSARYSVRAAAMHERRPSQVLRNTNHLLYVEGGALPDAPFVTAQFARAQWCAGKAVLELSSAGHPLPTVLRATGEVEVVGVAGTLLGVLPTVDVADTTVELQPGDTLLFITDGVHDSGGPRSLQQEGLERVLRGCVGLSAADIVDRVLEEVVHAQRDDVAILAVAAKRVRPLLVERSVRLPPELASAGEARRLLRSTLTEAGRLQWEDAGALALTEVVTNAVLHAHTAIEVRLEVGSDELRAEVSDANPYQPQQRAYDDRSTVGRGMALVAALTDQCGVRSKGADGKVVWFVINEAADDRPDEEVLAAWDIDGDWERLSELETPTRPAVLEDIPALLWLAAREHQDTMLRELVLYVAEHDDVSVELTLADTARQLISAPIIAAVAEARAAGTAKLALPENHPAPLLPVPERLTLTLQVPETIGPVYAALQHALDEAERLAAAGELLARPGLPEIVAVRNWAYEQILTQLDGAPPSPWPGTAQPYFETAGHSHPDDAHWQDSSVATSDRGVVAADEANRIVAVSRPLADLLGWAVPDLVGRRVVTLIPPRLREAHVAGFTRHLTTGESHVLGVPLVLPVLHAEGHEISCRFLIERAPQPSARSVYIAWIEADTAS